MQRLAALLAAKRDERVDVDVDAGDLERPRVAEPAQRLLRRLLAGGGVDRPQKPAGVVETFGGELQVGDRPAVQGEAVALGARVVELGLLVSQLNNYTLSPISEERVSEAAGVNSACGSFGLSFGLAFAGAVMLATLSIAFTDMASSSTVLPPADQERVAEVLEDDAQMMSNTRLEELLAAQPPEIREEIVRINTDARPLALQVALLGPLLAGVLGVLNALRMIRMPEPKPSSSVEGWRSPERPAAAITRIG